MCCSVLQRIAECCSVLQYAAVCLWCVGTLYEQNIFYCVAVCCSVFRCVVVCRIVLYYVAGSKITVSTVGLGSRCVCDMLQHVEVCCS